MRDLLRHPSLLVVYLLVYWGRTLFAACVVASWALWFLGHAKGALGLSGFSLLFLGFNFGCTVGELGPPPGRRR